MHLRFHLMCTLFSLCAGPVYAQSYKLMELSSSNGVAHGINNHGHVVGTVSNRPFLVQDGTFTQLALLPAFFSGDAYAINDDGMVVGRNKSLLLKAIEWHSGQIIDLGAVYNETLHTAYDINNRLSIVGQSPMGPYIITEGMVIQLPTGSYSGIVEAINNLDVAVGKIGNQAALWQAVDGRFESVVLGTLGGTNSTAYDINDHNVIVGQSTYSAGSELHAFRYENGVMQDLGVAGESSAAHAVNNGEMTVGRSSSQSGDYGTLWMNGVSADLNDLLSQSTEIVSALDVNDRGQIVGIGFDSNNGRTMPVLLDPLLEIDTLSPARAGVINTLTIRGALPFATVTVYASLTPGPTAMTCGGVDLGGHVHEIVSGRADHLGNVTFDSFVSPAFLDRQVHFQVVDQDGCISSSVVSVLFD